ncbi:MAG: bifunctional sulfate adenylyltransferase/adenylylsulfate kinase [Candidatus Marinimicrobia bacterium]|nr:bifunctional sulfate adenylyltransferase/adenylylsulfate kinase [Candidatus Neomarinimicrobiota bacterium]
MSTTLIEPHGGKLCNLILGLEAAEQAKTELLNLPSLTINERQICDLEMLLNGGFSPLQGYLNQADYEAVVADMRLYDGTLWPLPITLDVEEAFVKDLKPGYKIALRDQEGFALALLTVEDVWQPDLSKEAELVYGTTDTKHPGVNYLLKQSKPWYVGGKLQGLKPPKHYDYQLLRRSPKEVRDRFAKMGWEKVVAFQTRNPMHRAHVELTLRAANEIGANILIHPVVGLTKPGDVNHYTRVRCYEQVMDKYPKGTALLSLLPLAMRMGGPREAVWHAIIRKNYGCTHFIVGRDHAGPGVDSNGEPFYGPYDAQDLLKKQETELGIKMVPFKMMVYVEDRAEYRAIDEVPEGARTLSISGTELRRRLDKGLDIPEWFSYPEVVEELRRSQPPKNERGFTVFFTGLSGSGKSTIANGLMVKLFEDGRRPVTLLDGDIVRTNLSSELGFTREHRSLNIQRIGFVASEITKNGGIAICAPIAPYEEDRAYNRELIEPLGGYIEVFVDTPLEECERRDTKGLYAKARQGIIKEFTGISDPYEAPADAEIVVNTEGVDPETLVQDILLKIEQLGYI